MNSELTPKVLLWGGRKWARIQDAMLRESGLGETTLIFDAALDKPAFDTEAFFTNDALALKRELHRVTHYVVCIGGEHGFARVMTANYLNRLGLKPISLIHPSSFVEPDARIGIGCQIMPRAVVHKFVEIGDHTILNTNCTIDHECRIGRGVHIMGSAAIPGVVTIGDYATVGTNATVWPGITIGEGSYIAAGALVTRDVPPYMVLAGEHRLVRPHAPIFHEDALKIICA